MSIKFGNYTYKENERLGDGGYGVVYLARKEGEIEGVKRLYVIKIPIEQRMNDQKILSFNNEIDIL
jgi:serine/threonine protein kinase